MLQVLTELVETVMSEKRRDIDEIGAAFELLYWRHRFRAGVAMGSMASIQALTHLN
jgi:hypothetical protein